MRPTLGYPMTVWNVQYKYKTITIFYIFLFELSFFVPISWGACRVYVVSIAVALHTFVI